MNEGGRVLAALAGATLMVGAAVGVRTLLDGDGDGDGGSAGGSGPGGGGLALACPTELADVCQQAGLDVTVVTEDAPDTAEALAAAGPGEALPADLWLVPRPWVEAVDAARDGGRLEPLLSEPVDPPEPVARTPVVLAVWEERAAALESGACGGRLTWTCLGDAAESPWGAAGGQDSWGRVKAGLASPESASGPVVLGAAAGGYLETADYATNDIGSDLLRWLDRFAASSGEADRADAVQAMLTQGAGYLSALGTTEAEAAVAAGRDGVRTAVLEPAATVDLVVVPLRDDVIDDAGELADDGDLRDALAAAGWRVPGLDLADGLDPDLELPASSGVPSGAVLDALLTEWRNL